jgi:hypothetical protein
MYFLKLIYLLYVLFKTNLCALSNFGENDNYKYPTERKLHNSHVKKLSGSGSRNWSAAKELHARCLDKPLILYQPTKIKELWQCTPTPPSGHLFRSAPLSCPSPVAVTSPQNAAQHLLLHLSLYMTQISPLAVSPSTTLQPISIHLP